MNIFYRYICLCMIILLLCSHAAFADGSKLVSGDVIGVVVDDEKEFTKAYQINKDGCVSMPMIQPVKVEGLNTSDAAVQIANALKEVLVNPQVTVSFIERAKMQVYVLGQVKKTGLIDIGSGDRVMQAIAQAGYDDTADLSRVSVRRGDSSTELNLTKYLAGEDLGINMELESGDTVFVPRSDMIGTITITGQVMQVGNLPLKRGMKFREAIGMVGGVKVEADTEKIMINRQNVSAPIPVDYKKAMQGEPAADVALESGDIIFVPEIETSFFTVMGSVNKPGQYPFKGKLTVSEAIGMGGGPLPAVGDLRKVKIVRASNGDNKSQTVNLNLIKQLESGKEEPQIQRGDVIIVGERREKPGLLQILQAVVPLAWIFN